MRKKWLTPYKLEFVRGLRATGMTYEQCARAIADGEHPQPDPSNLRKALLSETSGRDQIPQSPRPPRK